MKTEDEHGCLARIDRAFRSYPDITVRVAKLNPDAASMVFPHESSVPVTSVCLRDAQTTLGQLLFALHQSCSEPLRHGDDSTQAGRLAGAWVERFYVEDAAMRLYNAAEHVADAISALREVSPADLQLARAQSRWERVRLVIRNSPNDSVGRRMNEIRELPEWKFAIAYRGAIVHEQPPIMEGMGIGYERRRRWHTTPDGTKVLQVLANGDRPKYAPEEVRTGLVAAGGALLDLMVLVTDEYFALLADYGIHETTNGLETRIGGVGQRPGPL